jgi:predicted anti-sigma-YlaC factor YlaD
MHYNADILDDYLHGALGDERDAVIHAHLEGCADCRALYDESVSVRDWIQAAARAEELEFPSMIKARVWEAVRNQQPSFADRLRAVWRPMVAVPIAAAIAVFAYVGLPIHGAHANGVAATYLLEEHAALASDNPLADRGLIVPASMVDSQRATGLMDAGDTAAAASSNQ